MQERCSYSFSRHTHPWPGSPFHTFKSKWRAKLEQDKAIIYVLAYVKESQMDVCEGNICAQELQKSLA